MDNNALDHTTEHTTAEHTTNESRTAHDAGWRKSRYLIHAAVPETTDTVFVNLLTGKQSTCGRAELYLLDILDELPEDHPAISHLAKLGLIVNYDEFAVLEAKNRALSGFPSDVHLTVCPTLGCNFDCPYCFEEHRGKSMDEKTQNDVVKLADRMLSVSHAPKLVITWFGGEPLLEPQIIKSLSERLIETAENHGATYSADMLTNGYLLDPDMVSLLQSCRIDNIQITIDGIGSTHDATRHTVSGGPSFDRIIHNLRTELPFRVNIRHNVHSGNIDEVNKLKDFVAKLAEETGNTFSYYPTPVTGSPVADARGKQVMLLSGQEESSIFIESTPKFRSTGHFCNASYFWAMGIDPDGNLIKCIDNIENTSLAFGRAETWDPLHPLETADHPDQLSVFINKGTALSDEECRSCIWLPLCNGGCPFIRMFEKKHCVPFKDDPEWYALKMSRGRAPRT